MDSTQILLLWLIMGFSTALIARLKGFRARTWFLLGVLLGPLAFLSIVCQAKKKEAIPDATHPLSD